MKGMVASGSSRAGYGGSLSGIASRNSGCYYYAGLRRGSLGKTRAGAAFFAGGRRRKLFEVEDQLCAAHELEDAGEFLIIEVYWNADGLDLVRIGVVPEEELMSTPVWKDIAREG